MTISPVHFGAQQSRAHQTAKAAALALALTAPIPSVAADPSGAVCGDVSVIKAAIRKTEENGRPALTSKNVKLEVAPTPENRALLELLAERMGVDAAGVNYLLKKRGVELKAPWVGTTVLAGPDNKPSGDIATYEGNLSGVGRNGKQDPGQTLAVRLETVRHYAPNTQWPSVSEISFQPTGAPDKGAFAGLIPTDASQWKSPENFDQRPRSGVILISEDAEGDNKQTPAFRVCLDEPLAPPANVRIEGEN
ncbi:MAG: hypothetical protein IPK79_10030 [Vampirovibrionales bacterium]|nr:hypothetical protein [Vampirovibrionales bacterium]